MASNRTHVTFPEGSELIFRYTSEATGEIERTQMQRAPGQKTLIVSVERKDNPLQRVDLENSANVDVTVFGFVWAPTNKLLRNCIIRTNYSAAA